MSEDKLRQSLIEAKELFGGSINNKNQNKFFKYDSISGDVNIHEVKIDSLVPAPTEWNFYAQLNNDKMQELIESILCNGLLHPIVVWEQEDSSYMILSGHNRVKAYRMIYEETKEDKYGVVPALVKKHHEIDEDQAKEIIIDTNWVSRQLNAYEKSQSITNKYLILRSSSKRLADGEGLIRDIIAEDYKISGRQIDNYRKLSNLIPELQDMLKENKLKMRGAIKLAAFDEDMQSWIYQNFKDAVSNNKLVEKIKTSMNKEDLNGIFNPVEEQVKVQFLIPASIEADFKKMANEWIKSKK